MCAVFFREGEIIFLQGSCPKTFELLLDVMERFLNLRESVRTPARITAYPTGRLFWVALSGTRARLRSPRPSGTIWQQAFAIFKLLILVLVVELCPLTPINSRGRR